MATIKKLSNAVYPDKNWFGQRVVILPEVNIGEHSIIGAGSIVTRDVPPYCIAVGNPAKVIKSWDFEDKCWKGST